VGDEIALDKPGAGVVPVGERPDRDLALEHAPGLGRAPGSEGQAETVAGQPAIDRRRRHPDQEISLLGGELELAGPLHRADDLAHERGEPFAAGAVERRPDLLERVEDVVAIDGTTPPPATRLAAFGRGSRPQGPSGMVPVPPRDRAEVIEDLALGLFGTASIGHRQLFGHRPALGHGQPHPRLLARKDLSDKRTSLDEATKRISRTPLVSQFDVFPFRGSWASIERMFDTGRKVK
jgi:hypothetical protein